MKGKNVNCELLSPKKEEDIGMQALNYLHTHKKMRTSITEFIVLTEKKSTTSKVRWTSIITTSAVPKPQP